MLGDTCQIGRCTNLGKLGSTVVNDARGAGIQLVVNCQFSILLALHPLFAFGTLPKKLKKFSSKIDGVVIVAQNVTLSPSSTSIKREELHPVFAPIPSTL